MSAVHSFQDIFTEVEQGNKDRIKFLDDVISSYVSAKNTRVEYLANNERSFDVSL